MQRQLSGSSGSDETLYEGRSASVTSQETHASPTGAKSVSDIEKNDELDILRNGSVVRAAGVEAPKKSMTGLALIASAFNVLNSWFCIGYTLALGLSHGGPVTLIYGLVLMSVLYAATGFSLSELSAKYPTSGGQYHWAHILAPAKYQNAAGYVCGFMNTVARLTTCAGAHIACAEFLTGLAAFNNDSYIVKTWHVYLICAGLTLVNLLYNAFVLHRAGWTFQIACGLSIVTLIIIVVASLVMATPKQTSAYVWTQFTDGTGWNNAAVVFLSGLINPNYAFVGIDGPIHLAEDTHHPAKNVPRSIMLSLLVGAITAFPFVITILYCVSDPSTLTSSRLGVSIFEIFSQATQHSSVTNLLIVLFTAVGVFTIIGSFATTSRLTFAFARDDAIALSSFFKRIDKVNEVPINAMIANVVYILVLNLVYLIWTEAFAIIINTGVVLEQMSFAMPIALLLMRGRDQRFLPPRGHWNLGKPGWVANALTVVLACLTSIVYCFPLSKPITASNMNYTCLVLAIVALLSYINWVLIAKKGYNGPKITLLV